MSTFLALLLTLTSKWDAQTVSMERGMQQILTGISLNGTRGRPLHWLGLGLASDGLDQTMPELKYQQGDEQGWGNRKRTAGSQMKWIDVGLRAVLLFKVITGQQVGWGVGGLGVFWQLGRCKQINHWSWSFQTHTMHLAQLVWHPLPHQTRLHYQRPPVMKINGRWLWSCVNVF